MSPRSAHAAPCLIFPTAVENPRFGRVVHQVARNALRWYVRVARRFLGGHTVGLACVSVARAAAHEGVITFRLASGGLVVVQASDRYWVLPLLLDGGYEPDLDWFLGTGMHSQDRFLDCGANIGIWSVATSSVIDDPARVVAIEAGATSFANLSRNAGRNSDRFSVLHRAVSEMSGETVEFFSDDADTASASLVQAMASSGAASEKVTTISLAQLLASGSEPHEDALTFLKLDIEGMEDTVIGSCEPRLLDDVIVLYEDHGRDLESGTTRLLLERGFLVWLLLDDGAQSITDAADLGWHKTDARKGYNLVATRPEGRGSARVTTALETARMAH